MCVCVVGGGRGESRLLHFPMYCYLIATSTTLFSPIARVHSNHSQIFRCVSVNEECKNVNCTGSIMFEGNLKIGLGFSGSCSEPAQINLTTSDTVGAIQRVKNNTQVVDCFWIPQDGLRWSIKRSYPSSSGSYVKFYFNLSTTTYFNPNASTIDAAHVEYGFVGYNGSHTESGYRYVRLSSDQLCGKPGRFLYHMHYLTKLMHNKEHNVIIVYYI